MRQCAFILGFGSGRVRVVQLFPANLFGTFTGCNQCQQAFSFGVVGKPALAKRLGHLQWVSSFGALVSVLNTPVCFGRNQRQRPVGKNLRSVLTAVLTKAHQELGVTRLNVCQHTFAHTRLKRLRNSSKLVHELHAPSQAHDVAQERIYCGRLGISIKLTGGTARLEREHALAFVFYAIRLWCVNWHLRRFNQRLHRSNIPDTFRRNQFGIWVCYVSSSNILNKR